MNPSLLSAFAVILLGLNPFSYLQNDLRLGLAIGLMALIGPSIREHVSSLEESTAAPENVRQQSIKSSGAVYTTFLALFAYSVVLALLSILTLLDTGTWELPELVATAFRALISLLFAFLEITAGYYLASHGNLAVIRKTIFGGFAIMTTVALYQYLAERLNLPFVGKYVIDRNVGLRLSGLAVEPKFLAGYVVTIAFFLWDDRVASRRSTLLRLMGLATCVYLFFAASSGNGVVGVAIMLGIRLATVRAASAAALGGLLALTGYFVFTTVSLEDVELRGSHADILNNLSDLDLTLFDDLLVLLLMAWSHNIWNVWFGFGPGLLNFYAAPFLLHATWVTADTYIKGNIAVIGFISQFGLVVFAVLFGIVITKATRFAWSPSFPTSRALDLFFVNSFVFGALISSNVSVPLYISIGWILCRANGAGNLDRSAHSSRRFPAPRPRRS